MPLSNAQYDQIIREYNAKQIKNQHMVDDRMNEVYGKDKRLKAIDDAISSCSLFQARKLLNGDVTALATLRSKLSEYKKQRLDILKQLGYSEQYFEPVYECPDCQDTGYIGSEKCHCFKQAMITLLYEQSNIREMLRTENFDSLSYEYYEGEDLSRFKNAVRTCRNFVKNFNSDYHNLFFYGTVGTGKSFLSGCVAKELIETGHSVIYFSATGLFDLLSKNSFDYKNREELREIYADLYQCDLLIIDDLGTELTNQFVTSQLFALLNERYMGKKATIISTNLSLEELRNRYSDRIFSRITSHYEICKLSGQDIRMYKKRLMNRK